jgi:glycosyltransferase involved in cell wall biosynthesis
VSRATVAVIVPAHNRAEQLDKALTSVEQQTVEDLEIVVVDDASTDATPQVCRRHASTDPRVRVLRMDSNVGAADARNAGLDAAGATYVAFMDGDDVADPSWLEDLLAVARAEDVPLVAAGHVVDLDTGAGVVSTPSRPVDELTLVPAAPGTVVHPKEFVYAMGYCWNKLYLRSAVEDAGVRFDPTRPLFEDTMFNLDLMRSIPRAAFIPSAQYHYVQHGADRLTNRPQVPDLRFRALLGRRFEAQCRTWGLDDQIRPVLTSLAGWSVAVECARTVPPGVDPVAALQDSLHDADVRWLLERSQGDDVRRVDRPVVGALRAGRARQARTVARTAWGLATARARVGARLAAR